jgi:hypothetical protein
MGNQLGSDLDESEFQKQIKSFMETEITLEHVEELNVFFKVSNDFPTFFTSCTLEDFRKLRQTKPANLIFMISQAIKIMNDCAL